MASDKKTLQIKPTTEVGKLMIRMREIKNERDSLDVAYKECEGPVKKHIKDKGVDELVVDHDPAEPLLSAMIYDRVSVVYDKDKMSAKLNKDQMKEIVDEYFVVSKTGLNKFIKKHPEFKEELKSFITRTTMLNEKKLESAFERGLFQVKDIEGCYETSITEVFRFSTQKRPKK